ncbi:hypothetical protein Leryth_022762 [Lithospermum erythrorhizon]|uniref:Protein kinase domain-containing protein n=1 Tax=Lithospermum erythrorhizon TaxID=34254 RepID=A0AAV3RNP4_LITER|nr:hypothetical protein Leryth_022762 [Lithospermum erythrorhizon]
MYSVRMLLPLLLPFLHLSAAASSLSGDLSSLLLLRAAVSGRTLFWNTISPTPCNWTGVSCHNNRVTALRLPAASLSGDIPANTLTNLTNLHTLSLRLNHLSGPFPIDLTKLTSLRNVFLQGNHFSGNLPSTLYLMESLVRFSVSRNDFSGGINGVFDGLSRLRTLYLDDNEFSGEIPELKLPNLEQFNVSFNRFNGSVPKSLEEMPENAFLGNVLCGKPLSLACGKDGKIVPPAIAGIDLPSEEGEKKKGLSGGAIAGIVVGCVLGLLFLVCVMCVLCRKKGGSKARAVDVGVIKGQENDASGEKPMVEGVEIGGSGAGNGGNGFSVAAAAMNAGNGRGDSGGSVGKKLVFFGKAPKVFDLEDLLRASAEVLGKGTFGTAYKAVLEMGSEVAVKRLKDVVISENEFREKIEKVGAMDHENLVPLRAYYYSREEKLLVYDYMPMGSLSALLHGNKGSSRTPLNWEMRSGIALGAACGIEYLHSQGPTASHGNIKSSNILLTKSYDARVSDFGLSQLVGPPSSPTRVAGYRAPEVTDQHKVSQKADVYSFGVLLLELLTGKAPTHALLNEEGVDLPRWVQSVVREEWSSEVFDLELLRYQSVEEEMVQLLQLAVDCSAQFPDNRPSMSEVARRIEELRRSTVRGDQDPSDRIKETI